MRTWVYHKDHAAKIIDSSEYNDLFKEGWRDSPGSANSIQFEVIEGQKSITTPDVSIDAVNIEDKELVREKRKYNKRAK